MSNSSGSTEPPASPAAEVEALRVALGARAAGWWRVEGGRLVQVGFAAAPDMPAAVAEGFAEATRSVPTDRADLGIVRALAAGVAVSKVGDLPPDRGSGLWLRRFGARRSVAVALGGRVASVALGDAGGADDEVAARVRAIAGGWVDPGPPSAGRDGPGVEQ